ncbi:MAG: minor capsid protein [Roseburia sp.]|nr:minor capsid protein [Roseburia sp.]
MSDLSYWERRKAQRMFEYMEEAEKAAAEIRSVYLKASRYISLELDQIFGRYRNKHGLSEIEARRLINTLHDKTSITELKEALRGNNAAKDILAELESAAYRSRMERLEQLQEQLDRTMQTVYQQEKLQSTSHYVDLAGEAYYKSIYDIQRRTGYGFSFGMIDPKTIERVINSKWSGANYSTRIWHNTSALAKDLKEEMLVNLISGRTDREAAEIIQYRFASGASEARRLVRTESCNLANQMEIESYKECDIEYYRYVATLDLRTSEICRQLDGKRFPVSEQQPGLNCPPMHPYCRSTTICDISDEELSQMKRRARDPVTGKTHTVPASMTYEQWYKQNVSGNPAARLNEKKLKNLSADRRQYAQYRERLGDKYLPKSLDDFQNLKYGQGDEYGILKAQVKGMSYYDKALRAELEISKTVKSIADMHEMDMAGFEYRLKGKDSFLRKIRSNYDPAGNVYEVKDIIRFTYTADPQYLAEKTLKCIDAYAEKGYNTIEVKNYWLNRRNPYNGINTVLKTPDGQKFELQYHTPESYSVKDSMHADYEKWRVLDPASEEAKAMRKKMFEQSQGMQVPEGIERVK